MADPFHPYMRELIADQLRAWVDGGLPYTPGHAIAVVVEGHCPRCLAELVPGRHGDRYGWCLACDQGFQAQRCTDPTDVELFGHMKLLMLRPSDFHGCGPA